MLGTPLYLSPEIIAGAPSNHKADMWALGVVLYEMVALHHPFAAENLAALALRISRAEYEPLSASVGLKQAASAAGDVSTPRAPTYSTELLALPARLLQVDANDRPDASVLLSEPLVLAHTAPFGESVSRCSHSAKVLCDAAADPDAFASALGLGGGSTASMLGGWVDDFDSNAPSSATSVSGSRPP